MMKKLLLVFTVLALITVNSCTERVDSIIEPKYDGRGSDDVLTIGGGGHLFPHYLAFSMFSEVGDFAQLDTRIYYPEAYELDGSGIINLPVLYLLSPFQANANYYFGHGLVEIADRMIASGEIDPMFIVCIDGSHGYGATFYGNSWAGGKYTEMIGDKTGLDIYENCALIDYISTIVWTDTSRAMRGISGFDLGGYGAMRVAIEYPENFGSVSSVSAPLDFDGATGEGGFKALFPTVASSFDTYQDFKEISVSLNDPLRTLMIGAACSFSPNLTDVIDTFYFGIVPGAGGYAADTIFFDDTLSQFSLGGPGSDISFHLPFDYDGNVPASSTILTYYDTSYTFDTTMMDDSMFTYVDSLEIDSNYIGFEWVVETLLVSTDTTFDSTIEVINFIDTTVGSVATILDTVGFYDSIWGLWLDNNLENILAADGDSSLDNTDIALFTVNDDYYGFGQQTRDFSATLSTILGENLTPYNYTTGSDDYEATVGHLVNRILPDILKFHSDAFRDAQAGKKK